MKKVLALIASIGIVLTAHAQYNTNINFAGIAFDVYSIYAVGAQGVISGAEQFVPVTTGNVPTVSLSTGANTVVSQGSGTGAGIWVIPGSTDTATSVVITNGNTHAWTNTTGYLILTNQFAVPRTGTNYIVDVDAMWFLTNNPMSYIPPGTVYPTNQATTGFNLAINGFFLTNVIPPLPTTSVIAFQYSIVGQ